MPTLYGIEIPESYFAGTLPTGRVELGSTGIYLTPASPGGNLVVNPPEGDYRAGALMLFDGVQTVTASYSPARAGTDWFDASDEATITASGGVVSAVANKISGRAPLTGTGTTGVSAADVNGLNTIVMDGVSNVLTHDGSASLMWPASGNFLFTVVATIGEVNHLNDGLFRSGGGDVLFYLNSNNATQFNGRLSLGTVAAGLSGGPYTGLQIMQIVADFTGTSTAKIFMGGVERASLVYDVGPVDGPNTTFFQLLSQYLAGQFCEAWVDPDISQQAAAHDYAASKWGAV
ncbi:hypothetical protein BV509_18890 [Rhodovulum sulfidophilum]|uniref:Uncharacterized protein n=1 Tax=Rhodovulum visakhapatnamense TaxID=364297 RepID=A0ABS1RBM6_9RHOB|nr:hypothetical protein [Rhodovulum visakhapatnamense]MBL3569084.1 hypothetical protein [Rhodovulum visakhapatnamense]MBL3577046.1 hypothetical protein [Rhodovulum visakhapatnamense]OLS46212.1 hypothetical protein BV509_18890 [Rhodovulum sulfidophilum]